jgi:hypothetical protein
METLNIGENTCIKSSDARELLLEAGIAEDNGLSESSVMSAFSQIMENKYGVRPIAVLRGQGGNGKINYFDLSVIEDIAEATRRNIEAKKVVPAPVKEEKQVNMSLLDLRDTLYILVENVEAMIEERNS